ncbi:MAG TPA: hypothetical protein VFT90_07615 [Chryseosolibacter sp.]|nr:hypothetical protein [Chryseosolibacter sp.]
MNTHSSKYLIAIFLLSTLTLFVQSCDDASVPLEKTKVQFALNPGSTSHGRLNPIELPERTSLRISIENSSGTLIFSDHEVQVLKVGDTYVADPLDLQPGTYVVTDFMIVKDSEVLNAAPKGESPLSSFVTHALPYSFSVTQSGITRVGMQVLDARNEKAESFGYVSFKLDAVNKLSFIVSKPAGLPTSLKGASAELRQGRNLIQKFNVKPGINNVAFEGEANADYTLSVFAGEAAKVKTFNFKQLKQSLGAKPLKLTLEPALLLTIESGFEPENGYEDYFEFVLNGTEGTVNVNWGDGSENAYTLPVNEAHEYRSGSYTAVITGDLDRITYFHGFAYSTIMYAITGLTNLTGLRAYDPSWGAVPIKVNLSNCEQLASIYIEKYGAPYEPIDLRTDFQLPDQHFISEFVFYAPSFDITREFISPEELAVFVDNIYKNTTRRDIHGGKFFVYPVETPSPESQEKLDILQNDYGWDVRLDGNIWDFSAEAGRVKQNLDTRRNNWLQKKFPNSRILTQRAKMDFAY